jgi:hypothetical protein
MKTRDLINAVLLALGVGTFAVVWATQDRATTSELEARRDKLLPVFERSSVTKIRMRRPGATLELERPPGAKETDFRLTSAGAEAPDMATLSSFLGALELASLLRPAGEVDPDRAGLQRPSLVIELTSASGQDRIALGGPAPTPSGARYAEVELAGAAPRRIVVSQGVVRELDLAFDTFRDPQLLELTRSEITSVESKRGDLVLKLELAPDGAWLLALGARRELASRDAVDALFAQLARLKVERFVATEQTSDAPESAVTRVIVQAQQRRVELALRPNCPAAPELALALRSAPGTPRAGCVPAEILTAIAPTPESWRLPYAFAARPDELQELMLRDGDTKLDLARKGDAFVLRAPSSKEIERAAAERRVSDILRTEALRRDGALGERRGEVVARSLTPNDRELVEKAAIGAPAADGSVCLERERDGVVLCYSAEQARAFRPDATLLKQLAIWSFPASALSSLSLERDGRIERLTRQSDGSFSLLAPAGFGHDGAGVADLVQAASTLRAERWVAERDDGSFGLEKPRLSLRLELGAGDTRELRVGAPTAGGAFASVASDPGVFVLPRSTLETLDSSLIDRTLVPFPSSALSTIEMWVGSRSLRLERRGESFVANAELPSAQLAAIVETIDGLRAAFVVSLGPPAASFALAKPDWRIVLTPQTGARRTVTFGAPDVVQGVAIVYARLEGVDATFAVPESALRRLRDF